MPKNKTQGIIFGIIMSYAMAYGMEVYNIAIKEGVNLAAGGFSSRHRCRYVSDYEPGCFYPV